MFELQRKNSEAKTEVIFSVDVDWAPEWMLEQLAEQLLRRDLPVSWFATGESHVLELLTDNNSHEIAIHPNFSPGSSHGVDYKSVLSHMLELYPKASGFRSHSLHVSSRILAEAAEFGLTYDSNLLIESGQRVRPFLSSHGIFRFVHHFSDAIWLGGASRETDTTFGVCRGELNVFDFHPVHLWLGANSPRAYMELKAFLDSKKIRLDEATEPQLVAFREDSSWPLLRSFFEEAIACHRVTFEQVVSRMASATE